MRQVYWILVEADGPGESEDEAGDINSAICDALDRRLGDVCIAGTSDELHAMLVKRPVRA